MRYWEKLGLNSSKDDNQKTHGAGTYFVVTDGQQMERDVGMECVVVDVKFTPKTPQIARTYKYTRVP